MYSALWNSINIIAPRVVSSSNEYLSIYLGLQVKEINIGTNEMRVNNSITVLLYNHVFSPYYLVISCRKPCVINCRTPLSAIRYPLNLQSARYALVRVRDAWILHDSRMDTMFERESEQCGHHSN